LGSASQLALAPDGEAMAWTGGPLVARFIEVVCSSGAPQMTLAEVEIAGEPVGEVGTDAPPGGLVTVPPRDLAPLIRLPPRPAGVGNLARQSGVKLVLTSRHYDDRTGQWLDDDCATADDRTGRVVVDGDRASGVRSFDGWYAAKRIGIDLALAQAAQVDRVVVWSAGHGTSRSFVNSVRLWLRPGPGAAWEPAGEFWNPLLPGEVPAAEYPIASPAIGKAAGAVRLELVGVAQSADLMQVGEVEVWGQSAAQPPAVRPWRIRDPVPQVRPVPTATVLDAAYEWLRRDRLRALYGYVGQWQDRDLLDQTVAAGFNAMIVHTMGRTHSAEGWPAEAAQWATVQQERGLRVIVSWPFGSDERYGNTQFGAYQPGGATTWQRGPCPLSVEYWDRVVGERAVVAARAGLTGLVVDMEMYGADATRYPGPCCCESCWGRFVAEHLDGVDAANVSLADRPAWIAGNGLVGDYARWQELQVMAILGGIRQRVRQVAAQFLLGNLLDPESLPGLARGFGTPTMPALVFSELEYHGGVAGLPDRLERLRREGYPVWYVPGLWIRPVTPSVLPGLVRQVGPGSGGFWIWSSAAFAPNASGEYAHAESSSHDDYWQAFRQANADLTAAIAAGAVSSPPEPRVGPRATVPRVDGPTPTPADWDRSVVLGPFVFYQDGRPAQAATLARVLWDGQRLHLWLTCHEPAPASPPPLHGERDDATLWQQDSIEVFWRRPESGAYAHVVVNAAGTVADAFSDGIRPEDPGWNANIEATASRGPKQWELRLAIPLAADGAGPLAAGSEMCFELARNRPGGGETTCWAPTGGMFRGASNLWGTLVLE
jgi:hypothetical protein